MLSIVCYYYTVRNILILSALFLFTPVLSSAYTPVVSQPETPYSIIPIQGDLYIEQNLLGDLNDFPDLYEFTSDVAFTFNSQIKQRDTNEPIPFGVLLVKVNDFNGGVSEISRQNLNPNDWSVNRSILLGMTFLEAPILEQELPAGTYRIEVSTPDNHTGDYMLAIGEESKSGGLWARFKSVFITQHHFGVFFIFAFLSPYVSIPILSLLSLFVWFKRKWQSVKV